MTTKNAANQAVERHSAVYERRVKQGADITVNEINATGRYLYNASFNHEQNQKYLALSAAAEQKFKTHEGARLFCIEAQDVLLLALSGYGFKNSRTQRFMRRSSRRNLQRHVWDWWASMLSAALIAAADEPNPISMYFRQLNKIRADFYVGQRRVTPKGVRDVQNRDVAGVLPVAGDAWWTLETVHRHVNALRSRQTRKGMTKGEVKNALRRLERKGTVAVEVRRRGWYAWKVYQYALPF